MVRKRSKVNLGLKVLRITQKLAEEAGNAGVPGVQVVALTLKAIYEVCEKAQHHKEEFGRILQQADALLQVIEDRWKISQVANQDKTIAEVIEDLKKPLVEALEICRQYADKSYKKHVGLAITKKSSTSQALEDCETKIRDALDTFMRNSQVLILRKLSDLESQIAAIHDNTKGIPEHQEEQRSVNVNLQLAQAEIQDGNTLILKRVTALTQDMADPMNRKRLEPLIKANLSYTYDLLEALNYKSPTPAEPEDKSYQYIVVDAIIEADHNHKLINMSDKVTKGKAKFYETRFIGHEKIASESNAPAKKYWIERITHPLGNGGVDNMKALKRIQQAIKMGKDARHENIIELYGYFVDKWEWKYWAYAVSEYYNYQNLDEYLRNQPEKNPLHFLKQLASGLSYLANKKPPIVHGDVRCKNVLVTDQGIAKLSGFSAAAVIAGLAEHDPTVQRTKTSDDESSMWWQSPAILLEDEPITIATDVWAFAITTVECLSLFEPAAFGRQVYNHPFPWLREKRELELFLQSSIRSGAQSLEYEPRPSNEYATRWGTEGVWQIVSDGLRLDPANRPAISELKDRLAAIVEEMDG